MKEKGNINRKTAIKKVLICVCIIAAAIIGIAAYVNYITKPRVITSGIELPKENDEFEHTATGGCAEKPLYLEGIDTEQKEYVHGETIRMEYAVVDITGSSKVIVDVITPEGA